MHFQSDRLKQEARQDREHIQLLISNYQALVESLKKRDDIVQKQFDRQDVRLARHRKYLDNHQEDIKQIVEDQVCMVKRMMGVMDMVIFWAIFFIKKKRNFLVFFTFTLLTLHFAY